jgi:hypothetical protein
MLNLAKRRNLQLLVRFEVWPIRCPHIYFKTKKFINDKGWLLIGNVEMTTESPSSSLIVSQALYQWMSQEISRKNNVKSNTTAMTTTI